MNTPRTIPLIVVSLALSPVALHAADDAGLRKQRMEAQQERQERKNERNREIADATRQFRALVNDLKTETRAKEREFDTEFQLKRAEINADHQTRMAGIDAEYQTALTAAYSVPAGEVSEDLAKSVQEKLRWRLEQQYEMEKQTAEARHRAKVALEQRKHELWSAYDRRALEEAEALGLTRDYEPILASPIGGELTRQEEQWNERERVEVVTLRERNEKLLSEFRTGAALRQWELTNLQDDFERTWQEKDELHAVDARKPLPSPLPTSGADHNAPTQQETMDTLIELEKEKRVIQTRYDLQEQQETIMRREERRKILAGEA